MRLPITLTLALVMALATVALGWWAVPLAAAAIAAVATGAGEGRLTRPGRTAAGGAALAAALAWGGLLALDATGARFGVVTTLLGGLMTVPAPVVVLVTLLLPALLAWSAAACAEGAIALTRSGGR